MSFLRDGLNGLFARSTGNVSSVSSPSRWLIESLGGGPTSTGISIGPGNALEITTVYACVRNLAEDVAKLKVDVWKIDEETDERKRYTRHELSKLLLDPNDYQDRFQFIEQLVSSLALHGNAYVVLIRNFRGAVVRMVCVYPGRVTVLEANDGSLFYQVTRAGRFEERQLGYHGLNIPAEDIIHIRLFSHNGLLGISPISKAREAMGLSLASEKYQSSLLANGARPGGVLKHPDKLSKEAADRLKNSWDNAFGGFSNTGKTAVLEEGMVWQALGMTSVDAEFMAGRRFTVEEICRIFRMPPHMVGDLTRSTNNNIAHQGTEYLTNTLMPYIERIEAAFKRSFDLPADVWMEFDTEGLTRGDAKTQAETDALARAGGWLTANEARARRRLAPKPGGDTLERPMNKMPATGKPGDEAPKNNSGQEQEEKV